MSNNLKNYLMITFISIFYAIGISLFLSPSDIIPGGVSGLSIMANHLFAIPIGFTIFILNVPLIIISYIKLGKVFFAKTLYSIACTSVFIDILDKRPFFLNKIPMPVTDNLILSAIFGGALLAFSVGFIFKCGGTTGGTDIVVRLLKLKYPHIETGTLLLLVDFIIIAISIPVFGSIEAALYATITVYVMSYFLDKILYGTDKLILMFIITTEENKVIDSLLSDMNVGITLLHGKGAYSTNDKEIIMCGIRKHQYPKVQKLIYSIDEHAFIIITSANEILGLGFHSHKEPPL